MNNRHNKCIIKARQVLKVIGTLKMNYTKKKVV